MSLSQLERETIINFSAFETQIYTTQPEVWRKVEKIKGFKLLEEGKLNGKVISKVFEFPKTFVRFTKKGLVIASKKDSKPKTVAQLQALQQGRLRSKSLDIVQRGDITEPVQRDIPPQEVKKEESHV